MHTCIHTNSKNVPICGFEGDVQCISDCSAAIDESSLPSVCSESCVGNRPIIIVEEGGATLETINLLLGMYLLPIVETLHKFLFT